MTPFLLELISEPETKFPLTLINPVYDNKGNIVSGNLFCEKTNREYAIQNGIPRFTNNVSTKTVDSFGDEWNHFNFIDFKENWLTHTVHNTFGSTDYFKDKIIIDAGGGSGSQTKWFLEYGAKHVILMDLSHSVDDVVQRNLIGVPSEKYDIIQCSIDSPPLKSNSIEGIVYCHNVIQHTPSVEKTAKALFDIVGNFGELVFNCYPLNDKGIFRWIRYHLLYSNLRKILSRMPFAIILFYARIMGILRLVPLLGFFLEKLSFCVTGDVPTKIGKSFFIRLREVYRATVLNTFDCYGSHEYQHLIPDQELKKLVLNLQPNMEKVKNWDNYFLRPQPIGCALRIFK